MPLTAAARRAAAAGNEPAACMRPGSQPGVRAPGSACACHHHPHFASSVGGGGGRLAVLHPPHTKPPQTHLPK